MADINTEESFDAAWSSSEKTGDEIHVGDESKGELQQLREVTNSSDVPAEDRPLPAFMKGAGSEFQKVRQTSMSNFELSQLPPPLKPIGYHLKLPYALAIASTVISTCAIILYVACIVLLCRGIYFPIS